MNGMLKSWLFVGFGVLSSPGIAGDALPQLISYQCRNCHSAKSHPVPDLTGLSSDQISQALLDFKYDRRDSTVMGRLAKGLSESEIQKLADWVAANPS